MTALNFPDSPSNGDTYQGYTYNSTKGTWAKPDSPDPEARTAVYANIAALPTSGTAGDMAYVTATNRLYLWTGTGWYNIALINNNPTISGVSATYALAIDGTATTVTMTATDPEGLPITYSIVSDTSGNTATVTQGTGANTNVFTITPSTNTAHAGTFSLTFRASDGVNIASSAASFTLQFKVVNGHYTTALITSVGANNAVNNSFDDKSTNDHTITAGGDAHQTTFSPYRHGGYSTYFDGSGDYLTVASSTEHDFGTGDFCVEFWWWPETVTGNSAGYHIALSAPAATTTQLAYDEGSRKLYFYNGDNGGNIIQNTGVTPTVKAWNHIALCRSGTTVSLYLNGTRAGTATHTSNVSFSGLQIGRYNGGGYEIDGYVRDVRLVKGSSIYDPTQTSLTLPTEPLTAVTNTTFLACHLPYIADGSTTGHAITVNGNTSTQPFAPYDAQEYSATDHGGSAHFDGSGDYVRTSTDASLTMGNGDFTIEGWFYNTGTAQYQFVFDGRNGEGNSADNIYLYTLNGTGLRLGFAGANDAGSMSISQNQWYHFALVRSGSGTNNVQLYLNGKSVYSLSSTQNFSSTTKMTIGRRFTLNNDFTGHISDFRVVKGTAVYTANFTPPTAPLTAITNTSLLLQGTDAGIIDKAQGVKSVKLVGDTKSSTTQTKYLSSSMYFDGTGDYVQTNTSDLYNLGTDQFTAECWMNVSDDTQHALFYFMNGGSDVLGVFYYHPNNSLGVVGAGAWITGNVGSGSNHNVLNPNQWHHVAISRDATTFRAFVDGTQVYSGSNSNNFGSNLIRIASHQYSADLYGYISDFRLTKGLARYTANFTPPTAALQG